jgi:hypothetical protein
LALPSSIAVLAFAVVFAIVDESGRHGPSLCPACGAQLTDWDAVCPSCFVELATPMASNAIGASDSESEPKLVDVSQGGFAGRATVGDESTGGKADVHLAPDGGIPAYPEPYPGVQRDETKLNLYIPGREIVHVTAIRGEWVQVAVGGDVVGWVAGRRLLPPIPSSVTAPYASGVAVPASRPVDAQTVKVDVLVGALAGVGVLIGALVDWTQGIAVNSFRIPAAFLFDPKTTSRDPRLGYVVLVIGLLGVLVSFLPSAGAWRVVLGLLAVLVAVLYCGQVANQLQGSRASFTDFVGAGPWVTGIAGAVLVLSPLFKSGY